MESSDQSVIKLAPVKGEQEMASIVREVAAIAATLGAPPQPGGRTQRGTLP
jgi:hypothetical protein